MILEGKRRIPVTLLEAVDSVDSGDIVSQEWFDVSEADLVEQWREQLAQVTLKLVKECIYGYPESIHSSRAQLGEPTYYPRRCESHSELDIDKTLREQFPLFQVVDNESYPAYFTYAGKKFVLRIEAI